MTSNEFVIWFKGFASAANTFNITPKQWDCICEQLEKVKESTTNPGYVISTGTGMHGITNTTAERRGDTTYNSAILTTKTILND